MAEQEYCEMKNECLSLDRISSLPENIIETILCLVPLEDAVRTSILSRTWRNIWTKIPKLEFIEKYTSDESTDEETISSERKRMVKRFKMFNVIYQVLLMHQGPIHEFTIILGVDNTNIEIDPVISHLSRNNAVKKLYLDLYDDDRPLYYLPSSIFSLHHLVDLYLNDCALYHQPTFNGFGSLTTLYLKNVCIPAKSLLHLLSNCPELKTVNLLLQEEYVICDENYTIIELFKCLPMVEHLTMWDWITDCFAVDLVPQDLPTSLIHLKYFFMEYTSCSDYDGLYLLSQLIRCSPNLEKIEIQMTDEHFSDEINSIIAKAYSNIRLENLNELVIWGFGNSKPDLEFVKFFLAKSPELKKVCLDFTDVLGKKAESKMWRILSRTPTASPDVKLIATSF